MTTKAKRTKTVPAKADTRPDELTPSIRAATLQAFDRMSKRRTRVQVRVEQTGPKQFTHTAGEGFLPGMANMQVGDAFGTTSGAFKDRTLSQIATVLDGKTERHAEQDVNAALAVLDGAKPENEIEAMLIAQMVVTNDAAMNCLAQVGKGMINQTEVFGGLAVKLLRTYTAQVEALAKLRRKGEQTVKVVHVYPGGQAVVGDVHHHPREEGAQLETEDRPCGAEELAVSTALPCPDPLGNGVPIASDAERQVQVARRSKPRRTAGEQERAQARVLV